MNHFHNEPAPTRALASLGSSIPIPAFAQCMTAVLCVRISNHFGVSWSAVDPADEILSTVTVDRWQFFFDRCLPSDDALLGELAQDEIAERWIELLQQTKRVVNLQLANPTSQRLVDASIAGDMGQVQRHARSLNRKIRNP